MHKVWFYIALLSLLIGGTYCSLPSEAEREQMKINAAKRKAEMQKRKQNQQQINTTPKAASAP